MGLSRLQGTSGYIAYFGSNEGKRTRYNCDHYDRLGKCCVRSKKIQECKTPGSCRSHTEFTSSYKDSKSIQNTNVKKEKLKSQSVISMIQTGSEVKLLNLNTNIEITITIVDPRDANRNENKISRTTMLGKNLLNRAVGQIVEYRFDGKMERYRVLSVR